MKRAFLIGVILLCAALPARADEFYVGLVAFNTGDFSAAERIWRPLAEQGNGNAQSGLGLLYYRGQGIARDYGQAREWFWRAAGRKVVQAQMFLSLIYYHGNGVPANNVLAYMWADIALANGHSEAQEFRDFVGQTLSHQEITQAWDLATEWRKFNRSNPATPSVE